MAAPLGRRERLTVARLYNLLLYLLLPAALLRLLWRSRRAPAYRQRWRERIGLYGGRDLRSVAWVHAVSVGEVQAAQPVIKHLLDRHPNERVMVTTTTPTGSQRLRDLFEDQVHHVYTPFDLPPMMNRFLDAVQPRLALVMETEIWPNMLDACEHRHIPVILANARLSARSCNGYAKLGGFTRDTLRGFAAIAAQGPDDAARFRGLGAPAERVLVTGSIKFDVRRPGSLLEQAEALRHAWGAHRPVWVAASTHEGEEEQILRVHRRLRRHHPTALLVLVPRHPERFDRVAALALRRRLSLVRRSTGEPCGPNVDVLLGDTMGELPVFLAAGDAAFIGGSLVPVGGHNLLEAAAVGVPVTMGPHTFNFAQITRLLIQEGAAIQISDADELAECMSSWLGDAAARTAIGENGRRVVEENRGALQRLLAIVDNHDAAAARTHGPAGVATGR
jgi:3-deoxy-D-manno-octulosonic-acid transferase